MRRASGADGVMVGRGAQGAPWRLAQIGAALFGTPAPVVPTGEDLRDVVIGHYQDMLEFYGVDLGVKVARKHLGWYLEEAGLVGHRAAVMAAATPRATISALHHAFADAGQVAA